MADFGSTWRFNTADLNRCTRTGGDPFWSMPRRLIGDTSTPARLAETSALAKLWRAGGAGPSAASILPILALHAWPSMAPRTEAHAPPADGWTPFRFLPKQKLARLAGVNRDTVDPALEVLAKAEHLTLKDLKLPPNPNQGGGRVRQHYSVSPTWHRRGDEPTTAVPWRLFYAGHWALLPLPSSRHLLLTIACLDVIRDEAAYLEHQVMGGDVAALSYEERNALLSRARATHPMSDATLMAASGIANKTAFTRALAVLGSNNLDLPWFRYVDSGPAHGRSRWHAPIWGALTGEYLPLDRLNDDLPAFRRVRWPTLGAPPQSRAENLGEHLRRAV